ncbi:hypothetical protein QM646_40960, partial [Rhodococcus erythropolis]|nr:hypothetical protein [Rhodococcus erythropolis]
VGGQRHRIFAVRVEMHNAITSCSLHEENRDHADRLHPSLGNRIPAPNQRGDGHLPALPLRVVADLARRVDVGWGSLGRRRTDKGQVQVMIS